MIQWRLTHSAKECKDSKGEGKGLQGNRVLELLENAATSRRPGGANQRRWSMFQSTGKIKNKMTDAHHFNSNTSNEPGVEVAGFGASSFDVSMTDVHETSWIKVGADTSWKDSMTTRNHVRTGNLRRCKPSFFTATGEHVQSGPRLCSEGITLRKTFENAGVQAIALCWGEHVNERRRCHA